MTVRAAVYFGYDVHREIVFDPLAEDHHAAFSSIPSAVSTLSPKGS